MIAFQRRFIVLLTILSTWMVGCIQKPTYVAPLSQSQNHKLSVLYFSSQSLNADSLSKALETPDEKKGAECRRFIETLPEGFHHGFVDVPLDWENPKSSKLLRVFYYHNLSSKTETPTLLLNGGYTDSHTAFELLKNEASQRPVILLDQRGTGCSGKFPEDRSLSFFDSWSVMKDAQQLLKQLQVQKIKILGLSSGGQISFRFLETQPVSDISIKTFGTSFILNPKHWVEQRRLAQKKRSEEYFNRYQDLTPIVKTIRENIKPTDCFTNGKATICGPSILDASYLLISENRHWKDLSHWLLAIHNNGNINQEALKKFVTYFAFAEFLGPRDVALALFKREYGTDFKGLCDASLAKNKGEGFDECSFVSNLKSVKTPLNLNARILPWPQFQMANRPLQLFISESDIFSPAPSVVADAEALKIPVSVVPHSSHMDEAVIKNIFQLQ